jgi:hypothetical protein
MFLLLILTKTKRKVTLNITTFDGKNGLDETVPANGGFVSKCEGGSVTPPYNMQSQVSFFNWPRSRGSFTNEATLHVHWVKDKHNKVSNLGLK